MLLLLPILTYFSMFYLLANIEISHLWRRAALRAAILCAGFAILATELLGLVNGVTPLGLALAWGMLFGVLSAIIIKGVKRGRFRRLPRFNLPRNWLERLMLAGVVLIILITGFVGLIAPVQSVDSLNYHMSRVAHWAQNKSIRHYTTGIEKQNTMSPGAEILTLHTYVLSWGDRFVNHVQWIAMILSVLGASLIAHQLGGSRLSGILAAAFVVSLPMGIAQSSDTMTDYVAAFWVLCAASESLNLPQERHGAKWKITIILVSMAAGLAILTKSTTLPFLLPFGVYVGFFLVKRVSVVKGIPWGTLSLLVILMMNAGYFLRNTQTYGDPLGQELVSEHKNQMMNARGFVSNTLRNAALHAGTPWPELNYQIYRAIVAVHFKLEIGLQDPLTTSSGYFAINRPTTDEGFAGNTAHAFLTLLAFLIVVVRVRSYESRALAYGIAATAGFLLFCLIFKWQIWGSRLHLPFFVLIGPLTAVVFTRSIPAGLGRFVGLGLILVSYPWVFGIKSRPIIPAVGNTKVESILTQPREEMAYTMATWVDKSYKAVGEPLVESECSAVGLMLSGASMEYLFWSMLDAPREDLRVEWIVSGSPTDRYKPSDFHPCAILCERCPSEWTEAQGLPLLIDSGEVRLFMFSADHPEL